MVFLDYERPPYRPPSEALSLLLRLVRGCPWNRCAFCSMYRGERFAVRPLEDLLGDIEIAKKLYGPLVKTAFLGDSDPLIMKTQDLVSFLGSLYKGFPMLERVTIYARIKTILKKPLKELASLREAGLTRLHMGLESGSSKVLERIQKGPAKDEMIEGARKAREAGFQVSLYALIGAGGVELSKEHALETAAVINQGPPDFIRVRTLFLLPNTPLYERRSKGLFQELSFLQRLEETRLFVERIEAHTDLYSDHVTNWLRTSSRVLYKGVEGQLPTEREALLEEIDRGIKVLKESPCLEEEILSPTSL